MKTKKLLSILSFMVIVILNFDSSYAQELHAAISGPVYNGGFQALKEFIIRNNHYSDQSDSSKSPGVVTLTYKINENGKIENIKILRGLNPKCDSEAVRITQLINGWQPAVQFGRQVSVNVVMPIEFYFEKDNQKENTVTGNVSNKITGSPIEGTLVLVKGTTNGAITDKNGNYSIPVQGEDNELEYSSIGYAIKSEKIVNNNIINVELLPEDLVIDFSSN